jgi:NhaP-type Na+/H+ or K+/H+ antiporter
VLLIGFASGNGGFGWIQVGPETPFVAGLAKYALFSVLFTDGMKITAGGLAAAWRLPGRALLLGMPINMALTAALAHYLASLPWIPSLLLGALLSPTDPVFAAAIVGRPEIPARLRSLLNVESGLNDGPALPFVLGFSVLLQSGRIHGWSMVVDLAGGLGAGILLPGTVAVLEKIRLIPPSERHSPLMAFAIGLLIFAVTDFTGFNPYLAAFSGGVTMAIRPASILLALLGSGIDWREKLSAAWFGPKGFATVVYSIHILQTGARWSSEVAQIAGLVVIGSILAHSSTDVVVARWFKRE